MALKMAGTSQIFELCENAPKVLHESYTPAVIRLGNNSERGIPRCEPSPSLRKTARPAAEVVPRGPASRTSLEPWGGLRALSKLLLSDSSHSVRDHGGARAATPHDGGFLHAGSRRAESLPAAGSHTRSGEPRRPPQPDVRS